MNEIETARKREIRAHTHNRNTQTEEKEREIVREDEKKKRKTKWMRFNLHQCKAKRCNNIYSKAHSKTDFYVLPIIDLSLTAQTNK